ncbi:MAG: hypothetical protein ABSG83_03150 [Roseiarcus sp.]|jgi:hypothetical protein
MQQESQANPPVLEQRAGQSRLLARLYRDIGLAAVAAELDVQAAGLEPGLAAAIGRGAALLPPRRRLLAS